MPFPLTRCMLYHQQHWSESENTPDMLWQSSMELCLVVDLSHGKKLFNYESISLCLPSYFKATSFQAITSTKNKKPTAADVNSF